MTLVLTGRIASKKNSKRVFRNQYTGKTIVTSSDAYGRWHEAAGRQLQSYTPPAPLVDKLSVTLDFSLKGKIDADVDNMMASVADLLQDMGFIANDKQIVEAHLYKSGGHTDFSTTVTIEKAPNR